MNFKVGDIIVIKRGTYAQDRRYSELYDYCNVYFSKDTSGKIVEERDDAYRIKAFCHWMGEWDDHKLWISKKNIRVFLKGESFEF